MSSTPAKVAPLVDPQGRRLDYLRLAVTERCNLRCRYCLPATGVDHAPQDEVLSLEEIHQLARIFTELGITRIRLTGGEPLARRGAIRLVRWLADLPSAPEILLTTNGVLLETQLDDLVEAGVKRINLSLESLQAGNWTRITRREGFSRVIAAMACVLAHGLSLKLNVVVLPGVNDHELPDFVRLTRELPVTVRFIEPMPFAGAGQPFEQTISGSEILSRLRRDFAIEPAVQDPRAVGRLYAVAGHLGRVGIIAGHSRAFCGTCNRLRVDAHGRLRTCLYGAKVADLGKLLHEGAGDEDIAAAVRAAVARRLNDGLIAERRNPTRNLGSMSGIGG